MKIGAFNLWVMVTCWCLLTSHAQILGFTAPCISHPFLPESFAKVVVSKNPCSLREKSATTDDIWLVNTHVVSGARGQLADKPVMGVPVHEHKSFLTLPMPLCPWALLKPWEELCKSLKIHSSYLCVFPPELDNYPRASCIWGMKE